MDYSTEAPDKVGDGSPNVTNIDNTKKSIASGEYTLLKKKRNADNPESSSSVNSNSLPKAMKSTSINSLSEALLANRYDGQCQVPFDIFIQSLNNTSLHPLTVGRILSASTKQDILEIKKWDSLKFQSN